MSTQERSANNPLFKDKHFCSLIFKYIQRHQLLSPDSRILLAVSGGLDSMVLLDFFQRFGAEKFRLHFTVAHLDHGLREDSAEAAGWLAEYCAAHKLSFVEKRLDIRALQQQNKPLSKQSSLEAVAREARYNWLAETAQQQHCSQIATAHSASDQLETVLMRLIRGGVAGLGGMATVRQLGQHQLIRPLLAVTRPEIEAYAQHHGLKWCEDLSNQDTSFFRNRVRAELIPWLLQENPELARAINDQSEVWRDEQYWLSAEAQQLFKQHVTRSPDGMELEANVFLKLPPALQRRLLREVLSQHLGDWKRYTTRHIEAIRTLAAGPNGKQIELPGDLKVTKLKGALLFCPNSRV